MNEIEEIRKRVEDRKFKLRLKEVADFTAFHCSYLLDKHPYMAKAKPSPVNFLDDIPFLSGYNRLVVGAHGTYIEFESSHLLVDLYVPEDQRWRMVENYIVKYYHMVPNDRDEKIYFQVGTVGYADYKVGKYYIDFYLTNLARNKNDI